MSHSRANLSSRIRSFLSTREAATAGLKRRRYQVEAAAKLVRLFARGINSLLPLPTGTGKTLICNLVARATIEQSPGLRALIVVPRRVLVTQHLKYLDWMANAVETFALTDQNVSSAARTARFLNASAVLVTTPELFANQVKSGLIATSLASSFRLIIADEFDEFLLSEYTDSGCECRFDIAFQNLLHAVDRNAKFLLMSATSPLLDGGQKIAGPEVVAASDLVKRFFNPTVIAIPIAHYRNFVPVTKLHLAGVRDSTAEDLDFAVHEEISMLLSVLEDLHTGQVDRPWVMARLDGLSEGRIKKVRSKSGSLKGFDPKVTKLFSRIRHMLYLRSFVYEDMCRGLSAESCEFTGVKDPATGVVVPFKDRVRLRGLTDGFQHQPELGEKSAVIRRLLRRKDRIVVMFRYVRLLNAVSSALSERGIESAHLHGEMSDRERARSLDEFRSGRTPVLLMTRDTGKRGLDLPQARAAIFYSPKASETSTFQEASRIRSTTHDVKTCIILYYSQTDERDKLARLVEQIKARPDRDYRVIESSPGRG